VRLRVASADSLGEAAADEVGAALRRAIGERGKASLAISGGRTPVVLFQALTRRNLAWSAIAIYQVDERVAPVGHADRNLTAQSAALGAGVRLHPMPVERSDLAAAAADYASSLPDVFDCIHLGIGDDGHTASLIPGDPALEATTAVAVTGRYQGRVRMTLTLPVLDRARLVVFLANGAGKRPMISRLLAGDPAIPAGRVRAPAVLVIDEAARP
jgi:6-phosphogluconolactonase